MNKIYIYIGIYRELDEEVNVQMVPYEEPDEVEKNVKDMFTRYPQIDKVKVFTCSGSKMRVHKTFKRSEFE